MTSISSLIVLAIASAGLSDAQASFLEKRANPSRYLFVTGDSFTSTNFNFSSPYPTVDNRFGNPPYPQGYIDGLTADWVSQLGQLLLPYGSVVFNGARGANTVNATFTDHTFNRSLAPIQDMNDQVGKLIPLYENNGIAPAASGGNTVYVNWFGVNDLFAIAFNNMTIQDDAIKQAINTDIGYYYQQVDRIYQTGIRKFVTILQARSLSAYQNRAAQYTVYWNDQMNAQAKTFASSHSGLIHTLWNPTNTWNNVIKNAQAYGAPNATCYSDGPGANGPHSCLFWDDLHPAQALNNETAKALYSVLHNINFG